MQGIKRAERTGRRGGRWAGTCLVLSFFLLLSLLHVVAGKKKMASEEKDKTVRQQRRREGGEEANKEEVTFPMIAQDTRFYNNATAQRRGAPLNIRLANEEGQLATFLLSELRASDHVLDIGGETGVFTLTASSMPPPPCRCPHRSVAGRADRSESHEHRVRCRACRKPGGVDQTEPSRGSSPPADLASQLG
eukprot:768515-Hanusia_phi.AAC.4